MPRADLQKTAQSHDSGHVHTRHTNIRNRLKRASGHLGTIVTMMDDGRDCPDVAQQLQAVIRALEAAKRALIHDHIDHCLEQAVGPVDRAQRDTIEGFKEITKYL